jgi:adenylate cyclase
MSGQDQNKNTTLELELTFLAARVPGELHHAQGKAMLDIYVPELGVPHPRLRLRQRGDLFEITKKLPVASGDASAHSETTIPLTEAEFEALAPSSSKHVTKTRYNITLDGHDAEVDVFGGDLSGLVLIDFEFATEAEKAHFSPPDVCLADVTQEDFIAGGLLAGKTYADIEPELDRLNYRRLSA